MLKTVNLGLDQSASDAKISEAISDIGVITQESNKIDFEADAQRYRQALIKIAKHGSSDKQYAVDIALAALRLDAKDL